jgi:hypothetical protein
MHEILSDPKFRPGFGFLRDRTGMEVLGRDLAQQAGVALRRIKGMPTCKFVVVVDNGITLQAVHQLKLMTEGSWVAFAIFGDLQSATDWVRLPMYSVDETGVQASA